MKRSSRGLVLLAAAVLAFSAVQPSQAADLRGESIQWRKSYYAAAQESARTNKPMLMQITATWCGPCHTMLSQTLSNGSVVERVNSSFIPIRLDADEDAELIRKLKVQAFPTTIVIDSDLTILSRIAGFRPSSTFSSALVKAVSRRPAQPVVAHIDDENSSASDSISQSGENRPAGDFGLLASILRLIDIR